MEESEAPKTQMSKPSTVECYEMSPFRLGEVRVRALANTGFGLLVYSELERTTVGPIVTNSDWRQGHD